MDCAPWHSICDRSRCGLVPFGSARRTPLTTEQSFIERRMSLSLIVVNPDAADLAEQIVCLQQQGCTVAGTTSFGDARALVTAFRPDALVTTVRIGDYNGIHLALFARSKHGALPTIVLGGADPVLEREAEQVGAEYVLAPTDPNDLMAVVRRAMMGEVVPRRWPRVRPGIPVAAVAAGHDANIVDVSYGGMGLTIPRTSGAALPRHIQVALPELGITVSAERVWSRAEADDVRYGLRCATTAPDGSASWRAIVEALRGVTANN